MHLYLRCEQLSAVVSQANLHCNKHISQCLPMHLGHCLPILAFRRMHEVSAHVTHGLLVLLPLDSA
jgi:hypothetical protein